MLIQQRCWSGHASSDVEGHWTLSAQELFVLRNTDHPQYGDVSLDPGPAPSCLTWRVIEQVSMKSGSSSELHCGDVLRTRICFVGQLALFLEEDPVAHFVILPNFEEDETVLRETLEILGCSPSAEKHMSMVLALDRLVAATGHLFEEVMATSHPPGVAGDVAETSSNTQALHHAILRLTGRFIEQEYSFTGAAQREIVRDIGSDYDTEPKSIADFRSRCEDRPRGLSRHESRQHQASSGSPRLSRWSSRFGFKPTSKFGLRY